MKKIELIREMADVLENYFDEGDAHITNLLAEADKHLGKKPADNAPMIEAIRQANINPLAP